MKVTEILEAEEKKAFTAIFKLGRHSRAQHFTHKTILACKAFTPAEITRALKLPVQGTLDTHFESDSGRTMVHITRVK